MSAKPDPLRTVQIFGVKKSQATRAAERFFKERRFTIHLVDLQQKPMSPGEIKRFLDKFGLDGIIDRESKAYVDAGMQYLKLSPMELLARIEKEPSLLKLPLVRGAKLISIGHDEASWKTMAS
jgi:arsenate reductase (glutaredoxin)